ncbi:ornithine cyclodeaminase [Rhodoligotrophos ferricapiens]|uniref:ornithine cyclodeaminase n=1 Tax=Rhodoligotrophos ferricapiens TaxID=3069264 RepID=UPI00315CB965
MRFVDAETVHRLLDWPGLIEALRRAHKGPAPKTARAVLEEPRPEGLPNMLLALPTWQHGQALGVKLVASFPGNVASYGVPTVDALYILFDPNTGKPQLVIDGEALIFRKTAADSALGAGFLAPRHASRLLIVGAGALAPYVVHAMRAVRPEISTIRIWNRTPQRAFALARDLREQDLHAEATVDLDQEVAAADIIIGATMATRPLIKGAHLKPGTHVNLIGSFTPEMREADDEVLRRARIYVDDFGCLDRSGEFIEPLRNGVINREAVLGNLFDLCQAPQPPQLSAEDITLFKNGGAGQLDLFVASHLRQRLAETELAP